MSYIRNILFFLICAISWQSVDARSDFAKTYPDCYQTLVATEAFAGDNHGDFEDDYLAILSDGSMWKVHPEDQLNYEKWYLGDTVRIKVRTSWYWFKREHKFELFNQSRGRSVRVMLIQHKIYPEPLTIVSTDTYPKTAKWEIIQTPKFCTDSGGSSKTSYDEKRVWVEKDFRKVLTLSDGQHWVIKNRLEEFETGDVVYVGTQGREKAYYDFVLIKGTEREAVWTWARPPLVR